MKALNSIKNIAIVLVMFLFSNIINAHDVNYENQILKHWSFLKSEKTIEGSFYMFKNGEVYIEDINNTIVHIPLKSLSFNDQLYVLKKQENIIQLNKQVNHDFIKETPTNNSSIILLGALILLSTIILSFFIRIKTKLKYIIPVILTNLNLKFSIIFNS